jgi:hypothetical protein
MKEYVNPQMTEKDYIKTRLTDQIDWYERKSTRNKSRFTRIRIFELLFSVSIPVLSGIAAANDDPRLIYAIGTLGGIVALLSGIQSLNRYQENWIQYRATAESLKREKLLYDMKIGPYSYEQSGRNIFPALVERVEDILAFENAEWKRYIKSELHVKNQQ